MIIIVTGANSFLGGHIIPFLIGQKATVFATYRSPERLEGLRGISNLHLIYLDVGEALDFRHLPRHADAMVHIAAASVAGEGSIQEFIACNVLGARNVADYARTAGVKSLVYTSTISVYGDVHAAVLDEAHPVTNPDDYGLTKFLGERVFAETKDLSCAALRLPGVIGKKAHRAWIPSLVQRVLNGQRFAEIYNLTSPFNNAAHVTEISEFVWLLLNTPKLGFKAVNVAADGEMTIKQVMELMMEVLGERIDLRVVPAPQPSFTISSEAAKTLGYKTRSIQDILRCYFEESGLGRAKTAA